MSSQRLRNEKVYLTKSNLIWFWIRYLVSVMGSRIIICCYLFGTDTNSLT